MPGHQVGGRAVSCADCYFRQELLCALESNRVCPTFRATVGRRLARPLQAPLTPIPAMMAAAEETAPDVPVVVAPERVHVAPSHHAVEIKSGNIRTADEVPFSESSVEARFSVQDARPERDMQPAAVRALPAAVQSNLHQEVSLPVHERSHRAAAARTNFGNELVIPMEALEAAVPVVRRGMNASRSSRIAQRIAARYPNSASLQQA